MPQQPERDLPLHRGLARLLAKQRNPVLKVVLPARGYDSKTAPPSSLCDNRTRRPLIEPLKESCSGRPGEELSSTDFK